MKRALASAALLVGSTGVALLAVELVLHVADFPPIRESHQRYFVEHDSLLGWRNVPGAAGDFVTDEYAVSLAFNERGFRGPLPSYAKPAGVTRVLLLGDSYVEGYTVPLEQRVSEQLAAKLTRVLGHPVETIALGAAGYSTDQELLWLEAEGLRYRPDVVVLMFYANDIWYNAQDSYWRGGKPRFELADDGLVLTNVPVPPPVDPRIDGDGDGPLGVLRRHSRLYWLAARVARENPRLQELAVRAGLADPPPEMMFDTDGGVTLPAEFRVFRRRPDPDVLAAWRTTDALLARMRDTVRAVGARFLAFYIPTRGSIYTKEAVVRTDEAAGEHAYDPRAVVRRFRAACDSLGLDCIDPTSRFVTEAHELAGMGERLYFRHDWHWNANGHRLAAEILAAEVAGRWFPPRGGRDSAEHKS